MGPSGITGEGRGERPGVTAPRDEAFARHFLVWMDRWDEQGLGPIARHWLPCARSNGVDTVLMIGEELIAGSIEDLGQYPIKRNRPGSV